MSGWEQRNAAFCKAQTDAEFAYIEAERRVKALEDENAKLRELVRDMWRGMCGYGHNCLACEHYLPRDVAPSECEFFTRMRELGVFTRMCELGVEVDG